MSETPPMTGSDMTRPRRALALHDHAVCAYDTQEEMLASLAEFLVDGERGRELMVFVHSFGTDDEAWSFVRRAAGRMDDLRENDVVVVSLYRDAFERGQGRIDHAHVANVVDSLSKRADESGRAGTRIFVDASRQYLDRGRADEWFEFEAWLGRRLQANVGLVCAYRRADIMQPAILPRVLRTHAYRFDAQSGT